MGRSPGLRDLHYPQSTACLTQAGKVNMGMAKAIYEGLKAIVWLFTAGRLRKSLVVIVMIYADEGMFRSHPRQPYDYFFYECIEDIGVPEDGGPQACAWYQYVMTLAEVILHHQYYWWPLKLEDMRKGMGLSSRG